MGQHHPFRAASHASDEPVVVFEQPRQHPRHDGQAILERVRRMAPTPSVGRGSSIATDTSTRRGTTRSSRRRSGRRRIGDTVNLGDHPHHGIAVVDRLEVAVEVPPPVNERVHRGGEAIVDAAHHGVVRSPNRGDDEVKTLVGNHPRRRQGGPQPLEDGVWGFVGAVLLRVEIIDGDEPTSLTVFYRPVVAAEADRHVLDRVRGDVPPVEKMTRQRRVGEVLRTREHRTATYENDSLARTTELPSFRRSMINTEHHARTDNQPTR